MTKKEKLKLIQARFRLLLESDSSQNQLNAFIGVCKTQKVEGFAVVLTDATCMDIRDVFWQTYRLNKMPHRSTFDIIFKAVGETFRKLPYSDLHNVVFLTEPVHLSRDKYIQWSDGSQNTNVNVKEIDNHGNVLYKVFIQIAKAISKQAVDNRLSLYRPA